MPPLTNPLNPVIGHIPILIDGASGKLTMPLVRAQSYGGGSRRDQRCQPEADHAASEGLRRLVELPGVRQARTRRTDSLGRQRPLSVQRVIVLAPSSAREEVLATAQRRFGNWALAAGTPYEVAEGLKADRETATEQFVIQFSDFATPETLELFAAEVIPAIT